MLRGASALHLGNSVKRNSRKSHHDLHCFNLDQKQLLREAKKKSLRVSKDELLEDFYPGAMHAGKS